MKYNAALGSSIVSIGVLASISWSCPFLLAANNCYIRDVNVACCPSDMGGYGESFICPDGTPCAHVPISMPIIDCVRVAEQGENGTLGGDRSIWTLGTYTPVQCEVLPYECSLLGGCAPLIPIVLEYCDDFTSNGGLLVGCEGDGIITS